jgi:hypothetical protein
MSGSSRSGAAGDSAADARWFKCSERVNGGREEPR